MSNIEIFESNYSELKNIDWNFLNVTQDALSNIHPYPARFIPEIPRALISVLGCNENCVIMDPFCGSGTTLLEAQRAGYEAVGVDLNPIACLISRVKTNSLPQEFLKIANWVYENSKIIYGDTVSYTHLTLPTKA